MTKRLDILVNLIKQGNGGKLAKDDLGGVELSAKEAEISVKALDAKYRELIKDVAAGNRTLDQAQKEYRDFSKELGVVGSQSDKARIDFVALNQAVELGKTIFNQAAQAIEAAYETLQEGAQVEAATRTFESLAASIDTTADALLGNLRMATQGMISDLDLMRSANQFTAMGLATTGEEAGRLAEIGSTLGAAFRGDAVAGMEEFALLLANQSIPRLDTFGISAGAVRSRIAELQEQTPGLSRETAFMTAVLEEADITMAKLGDSATNAAGEMAELQASAKNTGDTLKREFAEGLTPTLAALNDLAQGTRDAGFAIDTFADGLSEGISSALDPGVRTLDALSMHMRALATVDFSSWERFQATFNGALPRLQAYEEALDSISGRGGRTPGAAQSGLPGVTAETVELGSAIEDLETSVASLTEEQIAQNLHMLRTLGVARQFTRTMNDMGDDYELLEPPVRNANRAIQGTGEAAEDAEEAVISYADAIQLAREAELARIGSLGDYATSVQLATDNTFSANEAIFQHIDALNASPEATIAAGVALGVYTEAQARARIEAVLLEQQLREIDEAVREGRLTADEAVDAFLGLANGTYETARAAILASDAYVGAERALSDAELGAGDMTSTLDELKARLLGAAGDADAFAAALRAIPNEIAVKILLEQSGSFVPPPDTVPGGQYGGPRAAGGPVEGGTTYMVGERGRELFIPGASGHIVSNQQVERALQNISNRTVHYSDRSSVNFNLRGLNVRQAGRSLNRSRRQHLNRSLYG